MEAIKLVQADDSVRVLIMTGSERAFAAGADVKEMAEANPRYARAVLRPGYRDQQHPGVPAHPHHRGCGRALPSAAGAR